MKKLSMLAIMASTITFVACGQKIDASKVPGAVKTSFAKTYGNAAVTWEKEKGNYEANFKQDGKSMSVILKPNGTMLESEVSIKVEELPAAVMSYMKEHYKGITVKEAAKITKADGTINYEAEIKGKDVVFDSNGKFLKEEKD